MTAYVLLDLSGLTAPTQVYRALNKLIGLGYVHRLESMNAYVSCSQPKESAMTAFAICDHCGRVEQILNSALCTQLKQQMNHLNFSMNRSTIEVHGKCMFCHSAEPSEIYDSQQ